MILGYRIKSELLEKRRLVRGCGHEIQYGWKHCPECGLPAMVTEIVRPPGLEDNWFVKLGIGCWEGPDYTFLGGAVAGGNLDEGDYGPDGRCAMIPIGHNRDTVVELQFALKATLDPLGLWDEKMFGIWVFFLDTAKERDRWTSDAR